MLVTQISIGRFHHFHLARQLQKHSLLNYIYTGYPRFKLHDEKGIPPNKIRSCPWIYTPYMIKNRLNLLNSRQLDDLWLGASCNLLDYIVSRSIKSPQILIALSGSGFRSGNSAKSFGGGYICDRGSTHIQAQNDLLLDEYKRYGIKWGGINPRGIDNELNEYDLADLITVPSSFCYNTFVHKGIPPEKIRIIPYGARIERFYQSQSFDLQNDDFTILFVGHAGARKGFIDLIKAFEGFRHPSKKLILAGSIAPECNKILDDTDTQHIQYVGAVSNNELLYYYQKATVFVIPSIEEGLAMVIGESMACGCPVIATENTGASELINHGVNGFIVPIRSPESIIDCFYLLADNPDLLLTMKYAASHETKKIDGWSSYGNIWRKTVLQLAEKLQIIPPYISND